MKVRNIIIIILAVCLVGLAVSLGVLSRKYVPATTTTEQETTRPAVQATEITEASVETISVAVSDKKVFLKWREAPDVDGYYIYYDTGSGWKEYAKVQKTNYRGKGLQSATAYRFGIKTYTVNGTKETVSSAFLYTVSATTLPQTPKVTIKKADSGYALSWKAVPRAGEYIVYSMLPGQSKWAREAVVKEPSYTLAKKDSPKFYICVRAVLKTADEKILSDYEKQLISTEKASGTLFSCGDSIAGGLGAHGYSYADLFAEKHQLTLVDKSSNAMQISSGNQNVPHLSEIVTKNVKKAYNYVFLEGGYNDYAFGAVLGKVTADGTEKFDESTTCGALEATFTYLQKTCPKAKLVFVLIHNPVAKEGVTNNIGLSFQDYAQAIRSVCKKYNVAVADCMAENALDVSDVSASKQYTCHFNEVFPKGDGLQPTQEGYELFYSPVIEEAII